MLPNSPYILLIPGIRSDPENQSLWPLRAKEWIELRTYARVDTYLYRVLASTRFLEQRDHVANVGQRLLRRMNTLPTERRIVAAHSNGCAIVCAALREYPGLRFDAVHLFAAAEDADFRRNGLNAALENGRIGRLVVHCSRSDDVLRKVASVSRKLFGWAGLGYGSLGYSGPEKVSAAAAADSTGQPRVTAVWYDDYGHSDYFAEGDRFEMTMRHILAGMTL